MTPELNFKNEVLRLLTGRDLDLANFYHNLTDLKTFGLFKIEPRVQSPRFSDIGPSRPFYFNFNEADGASPSRTIEVLEEIIDTVATDSSINKFRLLLLSSFIEDHVHEELLQDRFYQIIKTEDLNGFCTEIISEINLLDWIGGFDLKEKADSLGDWDVLYRSFGYLHAHSNIIKVLRKALKKHGERGMGPLPHLKDVLKVRILLEMNLNDYLKVFPNEDFEFVVANILSRFAPHFPEESAAIDIVRSQIDRYSLDAAKFERLVKSIFGTYYFEVNIERGIYREVVNLVSKKLVYKIKDGTYIPQLDFSDFVMYPRMFNLFKDEQFDLSSQDAANHVVATFVKSLTLPPNFVNQVSFGFPFEALGKANQEAYAVLLHSMFICSSENFKDVKSRIKKCALSVLPHFFGRYYSENYATRFTTQIYLILLSVNWLVPDLRNYENRFDELLITMNSSVLEAYCHRLATHIKSFDPKTGMNDDLHNFFIMMEQVKGEDKLRVFSKMSRDIDSKIELSWPWKTVSLNKTVSG